MRSSDCSSDVCSSDRVEDPGYREIDFDYLKGVYREQIDALIEGGVDFILIETVFDTLNAKAGIMAVIEAGIALGRDVPVMLSMTLTDLSGRNLSGHTVEAFRSEERSGGKEGVRTGRSRWSPYH